MTQLMLPFLSSEITHVNSLVTVWKIENKWIYYFGAYPLYSHKIDDQKMFKLITAHLIEADLCKQIEIIKAFTVSKSSVIRSQKKLREHGSEAFFIDNRGSKTGGTILTPKVLEKAQQFIDEGLLINEIAKNLDVKHDTLRKAVSDGRLKKAEKTNQVSTKSTRTLIDASAADGMGTACTRVEERTFASFGVGDGAELSFEHNLDVPKGGVLCALPALLVNGLLEGAEDLLGNVKGYYKTFHILILLAFMALCRIKTVEKLRGHSAGEIGKLIGLDRIPEVRCLREKMDALSDGDTAEKWAIHLSRHWMESDPNAAGTLYIDGHVRVYNGGLTKLPKRHVSRERLCLRGTTDFWVNDATGRPFFVIEKIINPGLLKVLRTEIVPRLLKDIPDQPTKEELKKNPNLCRFIMVFDREGYSPAFFREMWEKHRIGCMTYHKHPDSAWPESWFKEHEVIMPNGEKVNIQLAEMGSLVGSGKSAMWMREIRKLTESGHQTSVISTAFDLQYTQLGGRMFSRWCQENFFRYMMEHFAIDLLQEYGVEDFSDTEQVINPAWREYDKQRKIIQNKLRYRLSRFADLTISPMIEADTEKYENWLKKKANLLQEIEKYQFELEMIKKKIKEIKKHINWGDLDEKDKFYRLLPGRKRLMDTVRMIAYRAETAMAVLIKDSTVDMAAARKLLQDLFVTEADLIPHPEEKILDVQIHNASRPAANKKIAELLNKLNAEKIIYPGTDMQIRYKLIGKKNENSEDQVSL